MTPLLGQRSRKRIPPFRLHRPATIAEAIGLRTATGAGGAFMAGGLDLVSRMKDGLAVDDVIHLGRLSALTTIAVVDDALRVGAGVTHAALAAAPLARRHAPALAAAWLALGNVRVRAKGTVGGNLMAADPSYDGAPLALALGATLVFAAPDGSERRVPIGDTPASTGELLLAVEFPVETRVRLVTERSLRPVVSLALGLAPAGLRVAVGCAYATPRVWPLAAPAGKPDVDAFAAGLPAPLDDWRASAGYRRRMIAVLLRRALARAA